ncbi:MAG: isoprenoid biosynthesis glyoxalase ElbB [Bacteroidetes bacterium]|nr:isoprenoid biosynthesis glyoxalase ElbB [Bacteroidota bacterium]
MKKFAVILAGCGVYDGAEIQEAVLTLLAIDKAGASYQCFAPDIKQHQVINHLTGVETPESRNVLIEAARIARGNIKPLALFEAINFDALIFPGGFGAAKNLCDWAFKGDNCTVIADVENAVNSMFKAGKPIGAMCIAPVILAKLFQDASLTTGQDPASAGFIEKMGNKSVSTNHGEVIVDAERKLFTTPCYMLDGAISQIAEGTDNIVREMIKAMMDSE